MAADPVAAPEICGALQTEVDEMVCARTPDPFYAVGLWYEKFDQTTDNEVRDLLGERRRKCRRYPPMDLSATPQGDARRKSLTKIFARQARLRQFSERLTRHPRSSQSRMHVRTGSDPVRPAAAK